MQMMYEKPVMEVERFQANEFFAACSGGKPVYKFECDAGDGVAGWIFEDSNNNGVLDDQDALLGEFTSCGDTHDAPIADHFQKGFYRPLFLESSIPVMIWTDDSPYLHATAKTDMKEWETAKS